MNNALPRLHYRLVISVYCLWSTLCTLLISVETHKYTGRFLHITDIHLDPTYQTNTSVSQFCHRFSETGDIAQTYGTLGSLCDAPTALVDSTFEYLKQSHLGVDFILYTGDSVRHDRDPIRKRTPQDVVNDHFQVVEYFRKTFDMEKVKIVPTFGNVDSFVYDYVEGGPSPELLTLVTLWKTLGLELDEQFLKGGYFSISIIPGKLDIISLNTNYFYQKNKAVLGCDEESKSPGSQQLSWLQTLLEEARKNNIKAYIIGHAPPHDIQGKSAYYEMCHHRFADLLGKYMDVILASFFGHTNLDSISYVYSTRNGYEINSLNNRLPDPHPDPENILGILYTAPSIIPFRNPAIRELTYVINPNDGQPIGQISDYTQFMTDLNLANRERRVIYEVEYVASSAYNVPNLSLKSWRVIIANLTKPNSLAWRKYQKYRMVSTEQQQPKLILQSMK